MSRRLTWFALALPLIVIAAAIVRAQLFYERAERFTFEVRGYDPRDLLKGRYIQFSLALDNGDSGAAADATPLSACGDDQASCCYCLTRDPQRDVVRTEPMRCETARSTCEGSLLVSTARKPWRFYVPETQADSMDRDLRNAREGSKAFAVLAIDRDGEARVLELRLNGRSYVSAPTH